MALRVGWADEARMGIMRFVCRKLYDAMHHEELSDDVLYMCDDFVFLQPVEASEIQPYVMEDMARHYRGGSLDNWQKMLWKTYDYCQAFGLPGYNFETHTPKVFNRGRFIEMMDRFKPAWYNARHMCDAMNYETGYFNSYPPDQIEYAQSHRIGILDPQPEEEVLAAMMAPYETMFYSDQVAEDGLLFKVFNKMFPDPSKWERKE